MGRSETCPTAGHHENSNSLKQGGETSWSAGCGALWPRAESETPQTGRSETCPTAGHHKNCWSSCNGGAECLLKII